MTRNWVCRVRGCIIVVLLSSIALKLPYASDTHESSTPIGIIDLYGLRTIPEAQVRQALGIQEGDSAPASEEQAHLREEQARARLEALPGVVQARLNFVCCDADKFILYVGIEESGSPSLRFSPAPQGKVSLPDEVLEAGRAFDKAFMEAIEKRDFAEDDSQGHALFHYPAVHFVQERFVPLAARYSEELRNVLRNSADSRQRALAAQVLAYTTDKQSVVQDLVAAMKDPDGGVRNNAMRALRVMAGYTQQQPELHIEISTQPFIGMLNSIEWTDRNKSSLALASLTEKRDPAVLSELRKQALLSLAEMARWKAVGHAQPAFFILGRLDGLSDEQIKSAWDRDREAVISAALKSAKAN